MQMYVKYMMDVFKCDKIMLIKKFIWMIFSYEIKYNQNFLLSNIRQQNEKYYNFVIENC